MWTLRQRGLVMTAFGVLTISPDALIVKLVALPDGVILLWRGLFTAIGYMVVVALLHRRGFFRAYQRCGLAGLGVAALFTLSSVGFVLGNQYTRAGNVLIILAASPLIAALLSRVVLGERQTRRTWLAIGVSLFGTALLVGRDLGAGDWRGNACALMAACAMASNFTLCRTRPGIDMSPMLAFSGLALALLALGLHPPGLPAPADLGWLALFGLLLAPIGFTLIQRGPLYLPAAEVSLLFLLETVFGTLWVWLALDEGLPPMGWAGGVLVLSAMLVKGAFDLRYERRLRAVSSGAG